VLTHQSVPNAQADVNPARATEGVPGRSNRSPEQLSHSCDVESKATDGSSNSDSSDDSEDEDVCRSDSDDDDDSDDDEEFDDDNEEDGPPVNHTQIRRQERIETVEKEECAPRTCQESRSQTLMPEREEVQSNTLLGTKQEADKQHTAQGLKPSQQRLPGRGYAQPVKKGKKGKKGT